MLKRKESGVWGIIKDNMKTSGSKCLGRYKLKLPEPWFDEGC